MINLERSFSCSRKIGPPGKYTSIVMTGVLAFLLIGCIPTAQKRIVEPPGIKSVFYLTAEVITVDGTLVTIRVEKPTLHEGDVKLALVLAQGIIENSYLLEGIETSLNQSRVKVMRVMGNDILLGILGKSHSFKPGDRVKIFLEKKIIAIKDFEVIIGRNKDIAKYVQEDLTTALVNSGQFNVVERLKLQSLLEELKLSQSGLISPYSAKRVGELLGADVILTGTLAATGDKWNVNLRLVNTETGLITAAVNKVAPLHELEAEAFRENMDINGSFEDKASVLAGWNLGTEFKGRTGKGGYQKIYIDDTRGANGTGNSLAMEFRLGTARTKKYMDKWNITWLKNHLKRDLGNYAGIKFYIRADKDVTIRFILSDSEKGSHELEVWFRNILVTKDWEEVRVPFSSLSLSLGKARKLGTNQILELKYTEIIAWIVHEKNVEPGTEGTIWVDEVTFY